jgi:hypothetical protein
VPAGDVAKPAAKKAAPRRTTSTASAARKSTPRTGKAAPTDPADGDADEPAKPKKKSVVEAAQDGTDLELLVAMRDRIAEDLDSRSTSARDLAALSKRLMELQREIKVQEERQQQEDKGSGGAVPDEDFDASAI